MPQDSCSIFVKYLMLVLLQTLKSVNKITTNKEKSDDDYTNNNNNLVI